MTEEKLRTDLERLRAELAQITADEAARTRLLGLVDRIEQRLGTDAAEPPHPSLAASVQDTITHFETEHPRATAILNDIMVALSNMGI